MSRLADQRARLLVVQRSGWGKSLVYFLANRLLRDRGAGVTVLVSPLLALMRNQIQAAARLGLQAASINSSNRQDWEAVQSALQAEAIDILLISPERLANDRFRDDVLMPLAGRIGLLVVDEAHCISDWGHDFRPDYRRIVRHMQSLPSATPVLATTATANSRVVEDIVGQLGPRLEVVRGPLTRDSLRLQNIALASSAARMAWLASTIPGLPGCGVVYTLTVRDAVQVADWLQSCGIEAVAYWGSLEFSARVDLEKRLIRNEVKVLVATVALGMGFDKPDLGFVIHFQRPASVIHYYQQVGRAGRAVDTAYGILLAGAEDDDIADYFLRMAFPPQAHIDEVLTALDEAVDGLTLSGLEAATNLSRAQVNKVLTLLATEVPSPVSKEGSRWYLNPIDYEPNREQIARIFAVRQAEQAQMRDYLRCNTCLMAFLRQALDDPAEFTCGRCSPCVGRPLLPEDYPPSLVLQATHFLRGVDVPLEPRRRWPAEALVAQGWSGAIADELRAEPGRALCTWGDDGWGTLVKAGKQQTGRFDDELVAAVVELVRERWSPHPAPTWVTCVPSLTHPSLLPDFGQRLALALGLPFVPVVTKMRATQPQKRMNNSQHQATNLAGAFEVAPWSGMAGPVLLVDDMIDSGWTFTIVAALLRTSGSGPVYPMALAHVVSREG